MTYMDPNSLQMAILSMLSAGDERSQVLLDQLNRRLGTYQQSYRDQSGQLAASTRGSYDTALEDLLQSQSRVNTDLSAQGVSSSPVQLQLEGESAALGSAQASQSALIDRLNQIVAGDFAGRSADAEMFSQGSRAAMLQALFAELADQAKSSSGRGGRGGGGGGYGGSGGKISSGDASRIGDVDRPLPDVRDSIKVANSSRDVQDLLSAALYGGGGEKIRVGNVKVKPVGHLTAGGGEGGDPNAAVGLIGKMVDRARSKAERKDKDFVFDWGTDPTSGRELTQDDFLKAALSGLGPAQKEREKLKGERGEAFSELQALGYYGVDEAPPWQLSAQDERNKRAWLKTENANWDKLVQAEKMRTGQGLNAAERVALGKAQNAAIRPVPVANADPRTKEQLALDWARLRQQQERPDLVGRMHELKLARPEPTISRHPLFGGSRPTVDKKKAKPKRGAW